MEEEERLNDFKEWLKSNGAIFESVNIKRSSVERGGYGLFAKENIGKSSLILSVPKQLIISTSSVQKLSKISQLKTLCLERNINIENIYFVIVTLILQRFPENYSKNSNFSEFNDNFWTPYAKILPYGEEFHRTCNIPLFWNEEEFQLINGTNLHQATKALRTEIETAHRTLLPLLKTFNSIEYIESVFTISNFIWAYAAFTTRRFTNKLLVDVDKEGGMIPLIDFTNHKPSTPIEWRNSNLNIDFLTIGEANYGADQEIFNNYGSTFSNETLLATFGFCYRNNLYDNYGLALNVGGRIKKFYISPDKIPDDLLEELDVPTPEQFNDVPLDQAEEAFGGILMLIEVLERNLQKLPTENADNQLMDSNNYRHQLAGYYRNGQHRVLKETLNLITNYIPDHFWEAMGFNEGDE